MRAACFLHVIVVLRSVPLYSSVRIRNSLPEMVPVYNLSSRVTVVETSAAAATTVAATVFVGVVTMGVVWAAIIVTDVAGDCHCNGCCRICYYGNC